jgi:hypothetical protein
MSSTRLGFEGLCHMTEQYMPFGWTRNLAQCSIGEDNQVYTVDAVTGQRGHGVVGNNGPKTFQVKICVYRY